MPIRVKCESCKKTLSVKDHLAGKKIKCPVCQNVLAIPAASSEPKGAGESKPATPTAAPAPKPKPAAGKPVATKPPIKKASTNGTPPADAAKTNGAVPKKPDPESIERPPENVEAEAMAAFADEPEPVEEGPPQKIDFKCNWCDEDVQFPLEQAGKQVQCPNPECRRIVKVPVPKIEGKKDWRKMDRRGPALAIVNQPEELENAWGTETTTRARHDSLAQAGAVEAPKKPPLGAFGWIRRGFLFLFFAGLGGAAVFGVTRLRTTNLQHGAIKEVETLLRADDLKIKNPLLRAEAHRVLALLYLREPDKAERSFRHFEAAMGLIDVKINEKDADKKGPPFNEELFLKDLVLSEVELGGAEDEAIAKKKKRWAELQNLWRPTLEKIQTPEGKVLALRELGSRLIEREQPNAAIQLAGILSNPDPLAKDPARRQYIAILYAKGDADTKKRELQDEPDLTKADFDNELTPNQRVGFAEGYARLDKFDDALKLANAKGPPNDKLDACIGVAYVALQRRKNEEASKFFKEALNASKEKGVLLSDWDQLQLIQLAARLEDMDAVKHLRENKKWSDSLKLRIHLEIFLAKSEKTPGVVTPDDLADLEADDKEGITLALAWEALARQSGATRDQNRKTFDSRMNSFQLPPEFKDLQRPMVDIGSYLGPKR